MNILEEAINTIALSVIEKKLQEWLSKRVPEGIVRVSGKLAKPDMLLVDAMGLKVVVEAKKGLREIGGAREKCRERVEEGLADICFALAYHDEVEKARTIKEAEEKVRSLMHRVEVLTPTKTYELGEMRLDELAILMNKRMVYEEVVSKEIVEEIAKELKMELDKVEELPLQILNNLVSLAEEHLKLYGGNTQPEEEVEEEDNSE
ncbi:MAG: hypothetical protein QXQ31_04810 [Zestosphaera sp.]